MITDQEFAQEKARLLGQGSAVPGETRRSRSTIVWAIVGLAVAAIACAAWLAFRDRSTEVPQAAPSSVLAPEPSPTPTVASPTPTPLPSVAAATTSNVHDGNCHMGECDWWRELKRETVGAGVSGSLIRLHLLRGTSDDHGSAVTWYKEPEDIYVFCSLALPSVIKAEHGGWQVDVLDLANGVPDVLNTSLAIYAETCHGGDMKVFNNAAALGYQPIPEEKQSVTISKPADVFYRADLCAASSYCRRDAWLVQLETRVMT